MRTVGEILSEKRQELGLTLEELEKETKIRRKYLEAIEKNNFSPIPEGAFLKGFIRNYSQALGLPADNILAVFRRDFQENAKGQIVPRGMVEPLNKRDFCWTPKLTILALVFLSIAGLTVFFVKQYLAFSSAPSLEIFSPVEGQMLKGKVEVIGKTDKDASIKIDGSLILVSKDGNFKEEIILPKGENVLTIEAANRQGKKRVASVKIKVE